MSNIALDLDGCLSNFHYGFSKVANKLFGTPIIEDIEEVRKYNWWDWGYPLTKEQHKLVWREIDKNVVDFWLNLKPLVSSETFHKLVILEKENNSIYFITSRRNTAGKNVLQQTNEWVKKYSSLEHFSVIPTEKKGKILDGVKIDYFIDDYPENLIEAVVEAPRCKSFLLVRPYNQYFLQFIADSHKFKNIIPVYSVAEFLDNIK